MKTTRDYLLDFLDYIAKVEQFTREGRERFLTDEKTQMATLRGFEVIGEIAKRLPESLLEQQPEIEWKKIKGFRDFLAHHYEEVLPVIVWESVEKLPELRAAVEALLASLPLDDE
ncbi:MAG: DUF86 domain-containing protein [Chloroflexi bacterium]|nr:MAG: DUF86 domain-containing protein [Phototrophicales bacterium]RMF78796.1 MAG: DUF86 domain-containing protein [Chloroflexota bacterium]